MSSKVFTDTFSEGIMAEYKSSTVRLIEKISENNQIWIAYDIYTDELKLVYENDLENSYYYD